MLRFVLFLERLLMTPSKFYFQSWFANFQLDLIGHLSNVLPGLLLHYPAVAAQAVRLPKPS